MNKIDVERLAFFERRIKEIAVESGLLTTDIFFEIVPSQRMLEGMAYSFPINFSHWTHGRDYERHRTIYRHSGYGIPYEQVWNLEQPRAFLCETNPFVLNVMVMAHVFGHVDYFLANHYLQRGRSFSDVAQEARDAAERFRSHEERYGKAEVEKIIDAGMSIWRHQHPDLFFEEPDEEDAREQLIAFERAKLSGAKDFDSEFKKPIGKAEIEAIEKRLQRMQLQTPPEPVYDLLGYIISRSPKPLRPWMQDILGVLRHQARALEPNRRTKLLDEGWATYWHVQIMRRLFDEKLLTDEDHGVFNQFHSAVTRQHRKHFNWYNIGLQLFRHVKERWDKGQFGRDYEECADPVKKAYWDTGANLGTKKIFELRSFYSDRMAVEEFFDPRFIRNAEIYIYKEEIDPDTEEIIDVIAEDNPEIIRAILKRSLAIGGPPPMVVQDGDYRDRRELYLVHKYEGQDLDQVYRDGALEKIYDLWGRPVYLRTKLTGSEGPYCVLFSFDGQHGRKEEICKSGKCFHRL